VYILNNIEARPCNHCCRGKTYLYYEYVFVALGIQSAMPMLQIVACGLYYEYVFVALGIQSAMPMLQIVACGLYYECVFVACGLSGCTTFFHIVSRTARFSVHIERKLCALIFSAT